MSQDPLEVVINRQQEKLRKASMPPSGWRWWKRQDPELLKVFGIVQSHLSEIQRLLILRQSIPSPLLVNLDSLKDNLKEMLEKDITTSAINEVWELADSLRRALLLLSDDGYILARLLSEARRNGVQESKLSWKAFLDEDKLKSLIAAYGGTAQPASPPANPPAPTLTNAVRSEAIECLSFVYGARADFGRHQRAAIDLKTRYLGRLRTTLTVLLILLLLAAFFGVQLGFKVTPQGGLLSFQWLRSTLIFPFKHFFNDWNVRYLLIAAFAGGVGSVLSGFFKLRDNLSRLSDLRSFKAAMSAQPFVGATIGVIFYLLILGGIFRLGLTNVTLDKPETIPWALVGVYCFIAGFSEPFFLGVVNSVAGAAEKRVTEDTKGGATGQASGAGSS